METGEIVKRRLEYQTYQSLTRLLELLPISNKRFFELTGGYAPEELDNVDQATAEVIEAHLLTLADYYADFKNIIFESFEDNQVEPTTNPKIIAKILLPKQLDRLSRDISLGRIKLLNEDKLKS